MRVNEPVTQRENDSMGNNEWICSKTDVNGVITYVNAVFCRISGYSEKELLGQPHNIVRHPDMPCIAYAWCWDVISSGKAWRGFVKNRCKNGDTYWVDATMTPQKDAAGNITGYFAVRRKMSREQIGETEKLYAQLRATEGTLAERAKLSRRQIFELYKQSPLCALAHPETAAEAANQEPTIEAPEAEVRLVANA